MSLGTSRLSWLWHLFLMKRDHCCCNTLFVLRRNGGTCAVSVPRPSRSKVNGWLANLNCSLYLIIPLSVNLLVCYTVDRHTPRENVRVSGSTYCTAENTISEDGMYLGGFNMATAPTKTFHHLPDTFIWSDLPEEDYVYGSTGRWTQDCMRVRQVW